MLALLLLPAQQFSLTVSGLYTHNEHLRETGILSAEAIADAFLATEAIKIATARERPSANQSTGALCGRQSFHIELPIATRGACVDGGDN